MLVGPIFSREFVITARRPRLYISRTVYCLLLVFLMSTAWLLVTGSQIVRDTGDLALFGSVLFQILAPLQMALAVFFSALTAASAVAQEKDRGTLTLLLLTHLSNAELVLGRLAASLLQIFVMLVAAVPIFLFITLFGGVEYRQVAKVFVTTFAAAIAAGSLGSTIAFWREKTYQTLAITVLVLVLWIGFWEAVAAGLLGESWGPVPTNFVAVVCSPWQAILEASRPYSTVDHSLGGLSGVLCYAIAALALAALLNAIAIMRVRVWNPSQETQPAQAREEEPPTRVAPASEQQQPKRRLAAIFRRRSIRHVWDNPILWREMRTWAYGRKVLLVKAVYALLFGMLFLLVHQMINAGTLNAQGIGMVAIAGTFVLSLVLINAQAVTALTTERDGRTLDLLLVSDLTPKEFVYGKLFGALYNSKEMIVLPLVLVLYLWLRDVISLEHLIYMLLGLAVMIVFTAMLGIHAGMTYANSRAAIATSLGTVFFLFVGVATCIRMMMAFSGKFEAQLPFLGLLVFGGAALYMALGVRNPSTAIGIASFACPLATFYAITSYFLNQPHLVFVSVVATYGFATAAMLIPAIDEFDVATGRTTIE